MAVGTHKGLVQVWDVAASKRTSTLERESEPWLGTETSSPLDPETDTSSGTRPHSLRRSRCRWPAIDWMTHTDTHLAAVKALPITMGSWHPEEGQWTGASAPGTP